MLQTKTLSDTEIEQMAAGMAEEDANHFLKIFKGLNVDDIEVVKDKKLPILGESVPAGSPLYLSDETIYEAAKFALEEGCPMLIRVRGDSMVGANVEEGDIIEVKLVREVDDGKAVVARLDGAVTIKVHQSDRYGRHWLAPLNPVYKPMLMDDYDDATIIGLVVGLRKSSVDICTSDVVRLVDKACEQRKVKISDRKLAKALFEIRDSVGSKSQWFSIYRVLVDCNEVEEGDFGGFEGLLDEHMGDAAPTLNLKELSRMNVLSFSKPLKDWDVNDAPLQTSRARIYLTLARKFERLLTTRTAS